MIDVVFPRNNEKEFIELAEKLGNKEIYFVYPYKKEIKNLDSFQKTTKIKLNLGIIANPNDIIKAKRVCNFVITESSDKNQHVLEKLKPNLIFNLEKSNKKDKMHYRLSGLNQVLCILAHKNKVIVGFSFSELLNADKKTRITLLGRIQQNIKLCRKYKVKTLFASFAKKPSEIRGLKDLKNLI